VIYIWKCETCVYKNNIGIKEGICERNCKQVFLRTGKENINYKEKISKPKNCNECRYCLDTTYGYSCCLIGFYDFDDNRILYNQIRKNYLNSNTPKWCQL
jgi:hypothetical protein